MQTLSEDSDNRHNSPARVINQESEINGIDTVDKNDNSEHQSRGSFVVYSYFLTLI